MNKSELIRIAKQQVVCLSLTSQQTAAFRLPKEIETTTTLLLRGRTDTKNKILVTVPQIHVKEIKPTIFNEKKENVDIRMDINEVVTKPPKGFINTTISKIIFSYKLLSERKSYS